MHAPAPLAHGQPATIAPWGVPFVGLPGVTARPADEDQLANLIRPFFSASHLERRSQGEFRNITSGLKLGDVGLLALRSSAVIASGDNTYGVNLALHFGHTAFVTVEGREYRVNEQPFLLPLCHHTYWSDEAQLLKLCIEPEQLVAVGMTMAASHSDAFRYRMEAALQRPQLIDLEQGRSRQLVANLRRTLWFADQVLRSGDGLSPMLALDDLLTRLVVQLLLPELDGDDSGSGVECLLPAPSLHGDAASDGRMLELLDWILANLQHPIRLTDLEARSGLARRTLQKWFKKRFGLGPMQWLRQQRLRQARQLIESSAGTFRLGAVAQACGYVNPASFSRDFHELFGERPSDCMRRARS